MTTPRPCMCYLRGCLHFWGKTGPADDPVYQCAAYPLGIPEDIVNGTDPHSTPEAGQVGDLTYSPGGDYPTWAPLLGPIEKGGPGSGNWGHAGRPGSRGGSAPGGGRRKYPERWAGGGKATSETDELRPRLMSHFSDASGSDNWHDQETRAIMKAQVVEELAERSGLDPEVTNEIVAQWAHTSNDNDMRALSLQEAAAEEFGVELNDWQQENIDGLRGELEKQRRRVQADAERLGFGPKSMEAVDDYIRDYTNGGEKLYPLLDRGSERRFVRAMYDYTQERLESAGFQPDDKVNLFRGVTFAEQPWVSEWDLMTVKGNPMESWAIERRVASNFADETYRGWHGLVLESAIPVKSIVSMATSGMGCLSEGEVIIMGAVQTQAVAVEVHWSEPYD